MKYARFLVLAAAMSGLTIGAMSAQETKKASPVGGAQGKADEKKVKGTVEYYEAADGWRWKVVIAGKVAVMTPKGVDKKEDVLKEIEDIKAVLASVKPTEGKPTKKAADKDKDRE